MQVTQAHIDAGQAVYTRRTLALYDLVVLGLSNRFIWKCPTERLAAHYQRHVSANHLDVGVGSGYFPARCRFPSASPRLALMDLNPAALDYAARRVARYRPERYRRNVLESIPFDAAPFDSVAVNYLLHCLPGDIASKAAAFDHLRPLLRPGARLFGATLLHDGVPRGAAARALMALYNRKGIFANRGDDLAGLRHELERRFADVRLEVAGCAVLFSARA